MENYEGTKFLGETKLLSTKALGETLNEIREDYPVEYVAYMMGLLREDYLRLEAGTPIEVDKLKLAKVFSLLCGDEEGIYDAIVESMYYIDCDKMDKETWIQYLSDKFHFEINIYK